MKTLEDVKQWLSSIEEYGKNAPEGVAIKPKETAYTLRDVNPDAIREFMAENRLTPDTTERGRKHSITDNAHITVLDFYYPFPKRKEECKGAREFMSNFYLEQNRYRLVYRPSLVEVSQNENGKTLISIDNSLIGAQG